MPSWLRAGVCQPLTHLPASWDAWPFKTRGGLTQGCRGGYVNAVMIIPTYLVQSSWEEEFFPFCNI